MGGPDMLMNLFRALAHTAAGVWLGGIIVIAIVAQTTFSVMRTTNVDKPNAIAGEVMARNFSRFDIVQICCAATLLAWQVVSLAAQNRGPRDWMRFTLIAVAGGLLAYNVAVLTPKIIEIQPLLARADSEEAIHAAFHDFHHTAVRVSQAMLFVILYITIEMAWPIRTVFTRP